MDLCELYTRILHLLQYSFKYYVKYEVKVLNIRHLCKKEKKTLIYYINDNIVFFFSQLMFYMFKRNIEVKIFIFFGIFATCIAGFCFLTVLLHDLWKMDNYCYCNCLKCHAKINGNKHWHIVIILDDYWMVESKLVII